MGVKIIFKDYVYYAVKDGSNQICRWNLKHDIFKQQLLSRAFQWKLLNRKIICYILQISLNYKANLV